MPVEDRLFDPGPPERRGEQYFHFGEDDSLDQSRRGSFHAGTRKAAEQIAQSRMHTGAIHHLELNPDTPAMNTPENPVSDDYANAVGNSDEHIAAMYSNPEQWDSEIAPARERHRGEAIFYANAGEDVGSVSVVAPSSQSFRYLGSEPHTPSQTREEEYHQRTDVAGKREGIGIAKPTALLQPRLFGVTSGAPSPYLTGMPDHGVPAGRPLRNLPSLEETFSKL